ncbi:P-loop containing nucleoside triphosphate hydrolase protein, partial [Mycena leptocephala]
LPASPKIFHGRESELRDLTDSLLCNPARAAILGPGGMGKTTLAMAALHHPAIMEKYSLMHFISCESANTWGELVTNIGLHLGLKPSSKLLRAIVWHFEQCGPCLVVLDNFETPWEPLESRAQVEESLSLLADIPSLALLVTMRGAERPGKVKWNRPFLAPLEPLAPAASRQIFVEVANEPGSRGKSALDDLLDLSGSLPLAVSLMANIASFEGYSNTLARWQMENTTLVSEGPDKYSNLEKSISLSLSSPRISSSPHAKNLISLLSLLPDGIRAEDIIASKVPLPDVRHCQSVLLATSLAYIDVKGRLKALTPVREYIRRAYPPSLSLSRPLRIYFQALLEVWRSKRELTSGNLAPHLVSHLGNINQLI